MGIVQRAAHDSRHPSKIHIFGCLRSVWASSETRALYIAAEHRILDILAQSGRGEVGMKTR